MPDDEMEMESVSANDDIVSQLVSMGFTHLHCQKAAINTSNSGVEEAMNWLLSHMEDAGGNIETATDWIFNNPTASTPSADASGSPAEAPGSPDLPDGSGRYKLMGFVSHIGTSTQCGHYVAHIKKDGRWVIYNDDKVGASVNPPKDMGYLYFVERMKD